MSLETDERVERGLDSLATAPAAVPMSRALTAELASLRPVAPRVPRRQLTGLIALAIGYAAVVVMLIGVRGDELGMRTAIDACAWLGAFVLLSWSVVVPPSGRVMPRWRLAGTLAAVAALAFVGGGLLFGEPGPTPPGHGGCFSVGLATALPPALAAALLVRGSVPVGSMWAGAAVGAAGGALGGFILELHCSIGDRLHLGLLHGGVVTVSTLLAVVLTGALARRS